MDMIARFYEEVGVSLCEPDFQEYLRQNNLNLFIEILAVGCAISLMKNLQVNVKQSLKAVAGKSDHSPSLTRITDVSLTAPSLTSGSGASV